MSVNKNIQQEQALLNANRLLKNAEDNSSGKLRSLFTVAAFGAVLTATGCASAPTTPDEDANHTTRTVQASTTYALGGLVVSALLGGDSSQNLKVAGASGLVGALAAVLSNRDDKKLRQELEEYGVEVYTITDSRNNVRTGAMHAHIPTPHKVGAGVDANMQYFRALYDAAAYLPVMLEKYDRNVVRDISIIYTMPETDGLFTKCDAEQMVNTHREARSWINGHLAELNTNLRVGHSELRQSPTGQTDRERLYNSVLRGTDPGPSENIPESPRRDCNEAEAAVVVTYRS